MQNKTITDHLIFSEGKVPPQAIEAEKSVLGAILSDFRAFDVAIEIIKPENFYLESHKLIFQTMMSMSQKGQKIDLVSICHELKKTGDLEAAGNPFYISQLTNSVLNTVYVEQHSRIILEKFMAREIIRIGHEMVTSGYDETKDVFDLIESSERSVFEVSNSLLKKDFQSLLDLGVKVINRIDQLRHSGKELSGVNTGFTELNRVVHGWQKTDLVILAARPSVGKSAFALNLAVNAKVPVGFFSLEMSAEQLAQRILSSQSEVWMDKITQGKLTDFDYNIIMSKGIKRIESLPIYIDDSSQLNIFEFRAKARRMVSRHKVELIIIDYLQLMSGHKERNSNREQEIANITRNLKGLAKDLNIPIIALSQLSRGVEQRGANEPKLSDLRESGAIEQDADIVSFLFKPDENSHSLKIAKHRNGSLSTIKLKADLSIQKFSDHIETELPSNFKPVDLLEKPF